MEGLGPVLYIDNGVVIYQPITGPVMNITSQHGAAFIIKEDDGVRTYVNQWVFNTYEPKIYLKINGVLLATS